MNWRIVITIGWLSIGIYRLVSWLIYRWECNNSAENCVGFPFSSIINDVLGRDFVWNGLMTAAIPLIAAFFVFKKIRFGWAYVVPLSIYLLLNKLAVGLIAVSEADSSILSLLSFPMLGRYIVIALCISTISYSLALIKSRRGLGSE